MSCPHSASASRCAARSGATPATRPAAPARPPPGPSAAVAAGSSAHRTRSRGSKEPALRAEPRDHRRSRERRELTDPPHTQDPQPFLRPGRGGRELTGSGARSRPPSRRRRLVRRARSRPSRATALARRWPRRAPEPRPGDPRANWTGDVRHESDRDPPEHDRLPRHSRSTRRYPGYAPQTHRSSGPSPLDVRSERGERVQGRLRRQRDTARDRGRGR